MFRQMLRSKIHRATVTDACLEYEGILPYEAVVISNLNNGERFMTYVISGERGSGTISLNGPTARKGAVGDKIIIFCYEFYNEDEIKRHEPRIIKVDEKNRVVS